MPPAIEPLTDLRDDTGAGGDRAAASAETAAGPLASFVLTAAALVFWSLLQATVMMATLVSLLATGRWAPADPGALLNAHLGRLFAIATLASAPPACATAGLGLYLWARRHVPSPAAAVRHHLGLELPRLGSVLLWSLATVGFVYAFDFVTGLLERPPLPQFMIDIHATAGSVWLLGAAVVVAAPLVEETLFRGLLLPGFTGRPGRSLWGLLLSAGAWAAIHAQYDLFDITAIFLLGLLFGAARLHSRSLWTPILLHAGFNLTAMLQLLEELGPVP